MDEPVYLIGGTAQELAAWRNGAKVPVEPLGDDSLVRAGGAVLVIEGTLGPLALKRDRIRRLAASGVKTILSASTTATVAAQGNWFQGSADLVGYDSLLMMAEGKTQTLVGANGAIVDQFAAYWPEKRFVPVADAIGLIFSREILPIVNEAVAFFSQGVAEEDIDRGVRLGLNYPKGPLEWAALFGWASVYWGLRAMEDMYGPRFRPHPWIRSQVFSSLLERELGSCEKS